MNIPVRGLSGVIVPFLLNANGSAVAGIFRRSDREPREWWWLPESALHPDEWVRAALARWREAEPDRFEPAPVDWLTDARWQTNEERAASENIATLDMQHSDAVRAYEEARAGLEAEFSAASE